MTLNLIELLLVFSMVLGCSSDQKVFFAAFEENKGSQQIKSPG